MFENLADNRNPRSLASRLRRQRNAWFAELLAPLPEPVRILDVGGTQAFWATAQFPFDKQVRITILNLDAASSSAPHITHLTADACRIPARDASFDVVFSNSVIEHVGGPHDQRRMADEVQRVGRRYFIQTPNKYFPIEPHFVFPLFQFLPILLRIALLQRFRLGWIPRTPPAQDARRIIESISLLDLRTMRRLFPDAALRQEKVLGLTKSIIALGGWVPA